MAQRSRFRPSHIALTVLAILAMAAAARPTEACRVISVELTPTPSLQMVIWLEKSDGTFVDTLFMTQSTGTYGLGNRPGRFDFNAGDLWPYGRREQTFPVWAHKHNKTYPLIIFQDQQDDNLSHALSQSSGEMVFCRPTLETEIHPMDAMTCPTMRAFTDKGMADPTGKTSLYPPRADLSNPLTPAEGGYDSVDAKRYKIMNDLDAISKPTPPGGVRFQVRWSIPDILPPGDYVVRVEASKERDRNTTYAYPSPMLPSWGEYGVPALGQPSIVWQVPITIDTMGRAATTMDYAGYGDPFGRDGRLTPPDATISNTEGSGAGRLAVTSDAGTAYRVKVATVPSADNLPPGTASMFQVVTVDATSAKLEFLAPGGDGDTGMIAGYEVRMRPGTPVVTSADFLAAQTIPGGVVTEPIPAGQKRSIMLTGLLPKTNYYVAVRATDNCLNTGPIATLKVTTPEAMVVTPPGGGCFIATAAFGSLWEPNVVLLRKFRDRILRRNLFGQLFVTTYYALSPPMANAIRPHPLARAMVRGMLEPLVDLASAVTPAE